MTHPQPQMIDSEYSKDFTREDRKAESGEKMEKHIRKALRSDAGRLAEIIVFNNRRNYYPIFQDIVYSFSEYTVANVTEQFLQDSELMAHCYVYEDRVIKGFLCVADKEIKKLYVDPFFQGEGSEQHCFAMGWSSGMQTISGYWKRMKMPCGFTERWGSGAPMKKSMRREQRNY